MNKPEKHDCVFSESQDNSADFSGPQKSAEPNSNANICSSTYAKEPHAIFLQCTQTSGIISPVSLLLYQPHFTPSLPLVNRPLPPSFSFPFTFPPGVHPSHTTAASSPHPHSHPPPLLSFYLNCKLQQCRLPEELLNVIRADPVD